MGLSDAASLRRKGGEEIESLWLGDRRRKKDTATGFIEKSTGIDEEKKTGDKDL